MKVIFRSMFSVVAVSFFLSFLPSLHAQESRKEAVSQQVTPSTPNADSATVAVPKKISGNWKGLTTGHSQAFSAENISVSGSAFSAKFTHWISGGGNCTIRDKEVSGTIEGSVAKFSLNSSCFGDMFVTLDFSKGEGVYKVGSNNGIYSFK